jgi:hypothetical protein
VAENDWLSRAPVFVINLGTVFGGDPFGNVRGARLLADLVFGSYFVVLVA